MHTTTRMGWALALLATAACGGEDSTTSATTTGTATGATGSGGEGAGCVQTAIAWTPCEDSPTVECASITVPWDHDVPGGETFPMELARRLAADPATSEGVLFIHFGGIVGRSVEAAKENFPLLQGLVPEAQGRFDLLTSNARGAGSTRVECIGPAYLEALRSSDWTPDDDAEWLARDALAKELADACEEKYGADRLARFGTRDSVRDVVLLLDALCEPTASWFGFSYGTLAGAVFASDHPDRAAGAALDATVAPEVDFIARQTKHAKALETGLEELMAECSADPTCPFHAGESPIEIGAAFDLLVQSLDAAPMAVGDRLLSEVDLLRAARGAVAGHYGAELWQACHDLEVGDGALALGYADVEWGRLDDGYDPGGVETYFAAVLDDYGCPADFSLEDAKLVIADVAAISPRLGGMVMAEVLECVHWPVHAESLTLQKTSAPPLLIVAGNHDWGTPVAGAFDVAAALDNGSYTLTHDQPGHVAVIANKCVRDAELDYLYTGAAPPFASCPAQ
jgi:pimeloyl-ACP methyl ester carboxylesterase